MRRTGAMLLLVLGATASLSLGAAEAEPPDSKSAESEPAAEPATDGNPSPDIFVPTEEISEDFAVPFPVDI